MTGSRAHSYLRLAVVLAVISLSGRLTAQVAIPRGLLRTGVKFDRFEYDALRQMLQSRGLKTATQNFRTALRRPRNTVMVILGDTTKLHAMESRIYTFYKKGGALLVANDQSDRKFLFDFRTYFQTNTSSYSVVNTLQDFADCPIVREFDEAPLLFDNVDSIVTNRPGFLRFRDGDAQSFTAAWLPPNKSGVSDSFLAIRHYKRSPGRLLALADHSVFTNQMLPHGSNLAFTNNVVDWLCAGGSRKNLIFVRDGEIMPKYSFGSKLPPIPPDMLLDAMSEALTKARPNVFDSSFREFTNKAIQSLQEKDFFNYAVRNRPRTRRSFVRRGAVLTVCAVCVSMLLVRMLTSRRREPRFHIGKMSKRRDHSATARLLIRDFFVSDNLTDRPEGSLPIAVAENWWSRRKMQRKLRKLWNTAARELPVRTSAKQLETLRKQLDNLNELRRGGKLTIQWEQ